MATVAEVLALAAALWVAAAVIRSSGRTGARRVARWGLSAGLLVPLGYCRAWVFGSMVDTEALHSRFGDRALLALGAVAAAAAAYAAIRWARVLFPIQTTLLLILAPFFPLCLAESAWSVLRFPRRASAAGDGILLTQPGRASTRVVWILFDEMDQYLAFEHRPPSVELGEFARFRRQAVYAVQAHAPAMWTTVSIPALLVGRRISKVRIGGASEFVATFADSGETALWAGVPNVFDGARALGFNTGLAGWHNPYCRLIGSSLNYCLWEPNADATDTLRMETYAQRVGLLETMRIQTVESLVLSVPGLSRFEFVGSDNFGREQYDVVRQQQKAAYLKILEEAERLAADARFGLVVLHFPVPHPPGIYDRHRNELSRGEQGNYFDNLELADYTLGLIRQAMERTGVWENSTVLVSSDHPLRPALWRDRPTWTPEEAAETKGDPTRFVPFLIKTAWQTRERVYEAPFNTVLSKDLLLAILARRVDGADAVIAWLDAHRRAEPEPETDAAALPDSGPLE